MTIRLTRVVAPLAAATLVAGTAAHLGFDDGASAQASSVTREALIQRIASDHAPTLLLDSSEQLRPVALDRYVGKADLYLFSYWRCFKRLCRSKIESQPKSVPTSDPTCVPGRPCHYYLSPGGAKIERDESYLELQSELLAGARPTVYWNLDESSATVQYWFFYVFNRFANRHEGDWEQITIEFNRTADFLARPTPFRVGYSSHEGGERRLWRNLVPGVGRESKSPIVFVARGSHANYFDSEPHRVRECPRPLRRYCGYDDSDGLGERLRPHSYDLRPLEPSSDDSVPPRFSGDYGSGNFALRRRLRLSYTPVAIDPRVRACVYQRPLEWLYGACQKRTASSGLQRPPGAEAPR